MKKHELLNKLLIEPKELTVKGGTYKHNKTATIKTNADETDFSFNFDTISPSISASMCFIAPEPLNTPPVWNVLIVSCVPGSPID